METCLFNTCSNNVAAYCKYHHCGMTVKQIKAKQCLSKQCWYLQKNELHEWWRQREITKQKRKERKERINSYVR
jgi:hypothetical protein